MERDGELGLREKEIPTKPTVNCSELQKPQKRSPRCRKQSTNKLPINTAPSPRQSPLQNGAGKERGEFMIFFSWAYISLYF